MKEAEIKKTVRDTYSEIAREGDSCCNQSGTCCNSAGQAQAVSRNIGYSEEELGAVPEGANLGLGCGNPTALASLKRGETVLDLGSGAGFDCFLAAKIVGPKGKAIGVDMTPEMIDRARENAVKGESKNVEFRLGEIENLPVADNSVDVIISNCVINLAYDKGRVFQEAFRVLKPEGRLMVSDIVLTRPLPEAVKNSIEAYAGCIAGAMVSGEYIETIVSAGFQDVRVVEESTFPLENLANDPTARKIVGQLELSASEIVDIVGSIRSVRVSGVKPSYR